MDYGKIIEDYQKILKEHGDCEKTFNEEYNKLTDSIDILLSDQSNKKHSEYFSDLFKIWFVASEETIESLMPENKTQATKSKLKDQNILQFAKKEDVQKLLQFSSLQQVDELKDSEKIIEYTLNVLWKYIFKFTLNFLSPTTNISIVSKGNNSYSKNWPLYELINQIGHILDSTIQEGTNKEIIIFNLPEKEKNDIIANSEFFCNYLLDRYIHNSSKLKKKETWLPELKSFKEIQLANIIATSDLVGYILKYKLMGKIKRDRYLNKAENAIHIIFKRLIHDNIIYDAMTCYIEAYKEKEIVITTKNKTFCPKMIFIFIIGIIQEVVMHALTKKELNIFHVIDKKHTKTNGIDEEGIIKRINEDSEIYMQFYSYLKNTSSRTISDNRKLIKEWLEDLNNLRFGILDNDLYQLSEATQISIEEETVTSIKMHKP